MNKLIILLLIILIAYALVRGEKNEDYPVIPFPKSPLENTPRPQEKVRPLVNLAENDPLITPPNINHQAPKIQELIRKMWTDLRKMIDFKNRIDKRDTERWWKKKDCYEALKFTHYQQFKAFLERWKYGFDYWAEWKGYLKEWKKLDPGLKEFERESIVEWKKKN